MSFSAYQPFERLGEVIDGSVKPQNSVLCLENSDHSALYFVDSAALTTLKKLVIATNTVSTIETRTRDIQSAFHDWTGDTIYFICCDNDGVDDTFTVFQIDLSDDSITEHYSYINPTTPRPVYAYDIYLWDDALFALCNIDGIGADTAPMVSVLKLIDTTWTVRDNTVATTRTDPLGYFTEITIAGTDYLAYMEDSETLGNEKVKINIYEDTTPAITLLESIDDYSFPSSRDQLGIAYDDSNLLYFIINNDGDSKNYLYTYELTDDILTQKGAYNVCLMLNRNTLSTHDMPFDLEKGFDIERDANDHSKIYQISKGRGNLYAKALIERAADVIAITDYYIITSDYYLYQWANYINAFTKRCVIYAKERAVWDADLWVDINWTPASGDWA